MKKHREILLMILLTFVSCVVLLGVFLLRNPKVSVSYADALTPGAAISHTEPATAAPSKGLININTATAEQLQTLPGIGPGLAQAILNYRKENGPFATVAELSMVPGIGVNRLEKLLDYITTGG